MSFRRLLPILLLALLLAPLGRTGAVEAKPTPQHRAMATPAHCPDQPPADENGHRKTAIDCTIACAAMAPTAQPFVIPLVAALGLPPAMPPALRTGHQPEADPPPPRFA